MSHSRPTTISCAACGANVTPRMWHYSPMWSRFRYLKCQHLCPICGVVMFETGGGLTWPAKILVAIIGFMATLATLGMLQQAVTDYPVLASIGKILSVLCDIVILVTIIAWATQWHLTGSKRLIDEMRRRLFGQAILFLAGLVVVPIAYLLVQQFVGVSANRFSVFTLATLPFIAWWGRMRWKDYVVRKQR